MSEPVVALSTYVKVDHGKGAVEVGFAMAKGVRRPPSGVTWAMQQAKSVLPLTYDVKLSRRAPGPTYHFDIIVPEQASQRICPEAIEALATHHLIPMAGVLTCRYCGRSQRDIEGT